MDNTNRLNTIEEDLRNSIINYVTNNLNDFSRNNVRNRRTTDRIDSILQSNNNSNHETIENILESLNRNMLIYHVNVSEYLGTINTILNNIDSNIQQTNRERDQQVNHNQQSSFRNPINEPNRNNNNINARATYYYNTNNTNPIRTRLFSSNRSNNENSGLWRRYHIPTSNFENDNYLSSETQRNFSQVPQPSELREQVRNLNNQQRTPFNLYRYLSHSNEPFINNELMQEYFQNLFQNVIISPTTEQIDNATEVLTYTSNLNLINHNCPITLEEFQENETIRRIRFCGHCFGEESIQNWFRNNVRCPVCRLDIRDLSGNNVERANDNENLHTNSHENTNNTEDINNDNIEETITSEVTDRNEHIPSPRPIRSTMSDLSTSTTSTINDEEMDSFLSNIAYNIRDNIENIMIPVDNELSSHIQLDIPLETFTYRQLRDISGTIFPFDYP